MKLLMIIGVAIYMTLGVQCFLGKQIETHNLPLWLLVSLWFISTNRNWKGQKHIDTPKWKTTCPGQCTCTSCLACPGLYTGLQLVSVCTNSLRVTCLFYFRSQQLSIPCLQLRTGPGSRSHLWQSRIYRRGGHGGKAIPHFETNGLQA